MGQPVTKVVNPLGTVITVSADEEDINSSQEFDSSEESHMPEPPRSVCAEEGPASLGDFEPESQTLRNLTKICAEMRSASEPAIDSVPDENICEVKERKTLCVEIASITNPGNSTIDFERVEAFRDVPTGLNLCVEQGEISSSPMTQAAKETAWYKRLNKREDAHERNVSEAQYVVSCDEDSVVLMENKAAQGRKTASASHCRAESKRVSEHEKVARKSGRNGTGSSGKRADVKTPTKRYVLKEHEDSIVIEDTCSESRSSSCGKKRGCEKMEDAKGKHSEHKESLKESGKVKGRSKSSTVHGKETTTTGELATESKGSIKRVESIIELDSITEETDKKEDFKSALNVDVLIKEMDKYKSPPSDSTDDFSCSEYHIVDAPCCNKDGTSVQSDEDIEHIQSSEISQLQQAECMDGEKCVDVISCAGSSPIMQRKNSKNTISDDDIEYIHSSEVETPEKACKEDARFETSKGSSDSESTGARCKLTFSDDDLEHVHHSDVYALLPEKSKEARERSAARRSHEISTEQQQQQQQQGSRIKSSKKSKDIVVIESDTSAADVTVIFKPVESWKSKGTERRDEPEEVGLCMKDIPPSENPSPLKRAKIRPVKTSPSNVAPKRSQAGIEIIDIDAMQKAEMDVLTDAASECKILAGPEVCGTRARKSRKSKKANNEGKEAQSTEILIEAVKTVEETGKESSLQEVEFSWSAVVKKKSGSPVAEPETQKEKEEGGGGGGEKEQEEEKKKKMEEDKVKQSSFEVSPILEKIESLKKKIHESSLRKSLDKKSCVLETYPEESSVQSSEISWSSIVKKKNVSSADLEARKEAELDPIVEESSVEERKTHRKRIVESLLSQSSTTGDHQSKEAGRSVDDSCDQSTEGSSWSFIVKKKATAVAETMTQKEHVEQKSQRKLDLNLISDSLEITTSDRETKSVNGSSASKSCEKISKLETVSEMDERGSKNWSVESLLVDPVFTKEDSSEPERDTEKRSDSEQEIVPERSSSSDELNANVVFTNNEGEYSGREVTDRGATNGSSSVPGTKKSNRSKKKKRR